MVAVRRIAFGILVAVALSQGEALTVACSANMQFAMDSMRVAFARERGTEVRVVYGSSGKIVSQIRNGAPFDVFVSADMGYPESLYVWKLATERPRPYAYGTLVLWSRRPGLARAGLAACASDSVRTVAIGDPRITVYGNAAVTALRTAGVYDKVKPRLVYAETVALVAQYVLTGTADVGLCARSVAMAAPARSRGEWVDVDSSLYAPIEQGIVALAHGMRGRPDQTRAFVAWMTGPTSRRLLERFGYRLAREVPQ